MTLPKPHSIGPMYEATPLKPAHRQALAALGEALAALEDEPAAPVPCMTPHLAESFQANWLADRGPAAEAAADLCELCPVFAACRAAGRFEAAGVWAGDVRSPARLTADRRQARAQAEAEAREVAANAQSEAEAQQPTAAA